MLGKTGWRIAVVFFLIELSAAAEDWYPRGRIIGSVEIPALHDTVNREHRTKQPRAIPLYSDPAEDAARVMTAKDRSEIESLEHGYEQVSAGVVEIKSQGGHRWYRVQYKSAGRTGTGWLSERDAGRFRTLSEILKGRGFLTDAWDGVLYRAPRQAAPKETAPQLRDRPDVLVADSAGDPEKLWLLVVIVDGTICDNGSRSVIAAGWIPAHSESGRLTTWRYSRGC